MVGEEEHATLPLGILQEQVAPGPEKTHCSKSLNAALGGIVEDGRPDVEDTG